MNTLLTTWMTLPAWHPWDTAIVLTGALAAMSCALPGVWLVLRRQSMMGDALSHTALPGVVVAFLVAHSLRAAGWISATTYEGFLPLLLVIGAVAVGVLTALLTEWIQNLGRVESSAALGVVFTSLFALGLLLVRLKADDVHLDLDCVLFGQLELVVWDTLSVLGYDIPRAALWNAAALAVNLLLMLLFYKELRIATFDPELATSIGIRARLVNHLLMAVTAVTVVLAFESVGSILVIGLLIVPAACALLLTERLWAMIAVTLSVAALSAGLGHLLARTLPPLVFGPLGFPQVRDAGTSGMICVACGLFFVAALLFSPRQGLIGRWVMRMRLTLQIAAQDVLAILYRLEERDTGVPTTAGREPLVHAGASDTTTVPQFSTSPRPESLSVELPIESVRSLAPWISPLLWRTTLWKLARTGWIQRSADLLRLTESGRTEAKTLVRSHRLWESYVQKHSIVGEERLHESAHLIEHYLDRDLQQQLEEELDFPQTDPHGREIPESG